MRKKQHSRKEHDYDIISTFTLQENNFTFHWSQTHRRKWKGPNAVQKKVMFYISHAPL